MNFFGRASPSLTAAFKIVYALKPGLSTTTYNVMSRMIRPPPLRLRRFTATLAHTKTPRAFTAKVDLPHD